MGFVLLFLSWAANAQNVQHLSVPQPGGMPGLPVMTGTTRSTNGVTVTWDGPPGYYQLLQKKTLKDATWQTVGKATNYVRFANLPLTNTSAFFRVSGPTPNYAGSAVCASCHASILNTETHTLHASAFTNAIFAASGGQTNASCLPCHTVGYGVPTGFTNIVKTPKLAGVQCENCHGPAANHTANPTDPTTWPRLEQAATLCGGCHTGSEHPTYDEWKSSEHIEVISGLTATNTIDSCGRCHSVTARLSLMQGSPLPLGDVNLGITCVVCHDPHQTNANPFQLRYPVASTNDYFMTTNKGTFTKEFNATINICGQCHNDVGASWTNNLSQPHPSAQYNMLLGTVGDPGTGLPHYQPAAHGANIPNQCVGCHMQSAPYVSEASPAVTGHSFRVERYDMCNTCHVMPQLLQQFAQSAISNQVQTVKLDLDYWATLKAPAALFTKYGKSSWEYTTPGELSPGGPGPSASEQLLIPEEIRKARFNLYLIVSDGSYGVHNGPYTFDLLAAAQNWIFDAIYH